MIKILKTANYIFINKNEIRILIINCKTNAILFDETNEPKCFNESLFVTDVRELKYTITDSLLRAEKLLQTIFTDFILVVDGITVENREAEINRKFSRPKKISRQDIERISIKAKELVFDSDLSIFSIRPSKFIFNKNQQSHSIAFDTSFSDILIYFAMLGFEKTTFNNLINIINECKINILFATTSEVLAANEEIVNKNTQVEDVNQVLISVNQKVSSVLILKQSCFCFYTNINYGFNGLITKVAGLLEIKELDAQKILENYFCKRQENKQIETEDDHESSLDNTTIMQIKDVVQKFYLEIISTGIEKYNLSIQNGSQSTQIQNKEFFDVLLCGTYNMYIDPLNLIKLTNATVGIKNYIFHFASKNDSINNNKLCSIEFLSKIFNDCNEKNTLKIINKIYKFFS